MRLSNRPSGVRSGGLVAGRSRRNPVTVDPVQACEHLEVADRPGEPRAMSAPYREFTRTPLSPTGSRTYLRDAPGGGANGTTPVIRLILNLLWFVFGGWLSGLLWLFGGAVLALTIVTIASLGKLFSEAVEGIDPGPVDALTATGANRLQVVWFSIVPQIVPNFVSFIIYHWDINVRISTIIGYVGGGGIGYYLAQMINTGQDHKAGTAIWAIVIVVWAMDFISAEVRKRYT